jgi:hypothetical protein
MVGGKNRHPRARSATTAENEILILYSLENSLNIFRDKKENRKIFSYETSAINPGHPLAHLYEHHPGQVGEGECCERSGIIDIGDKREYDFSAREKRMQGTSASVLRRS